MPTAACVGKRRHLVWDPKTLNFHVLKPGLDPQNTEFSCAQAWFGAPKQRIFMCSGLVWNPKMPTAAYVGKRRQFVWNPKTLNFHVLKPGFGIQNTEFSRVHAWFGTPEHWIFMCAGLVWDPKMPTAAYVGKRRHLVWDPKTLNFHVLKPGLGPQNTEFSCAQAWLGTPKHWIFMWCMYYDHNTCMRYYHNICMWYDKLHACIMIIIHSCIMILIPACIIYNACI